MSEFYTGPESRVEDLGSEESTKKNNSNRRAVPYAAAAVASSALGYAAYRHNIDYDSLFDTQIIPSPDVFPGMVDGFVSVNEGIRSVAPYVLMGGLGVRATQKILSTKKPKSKALESLSSREYTGISTAPEKQDGGEKGSRFGSAREKASKFIAGMGVASMAVVLAGSFSSLEQEIANGPIRPIDEFIESFSGNDDNELVFITQSDSTTLMDDSYLPQGELNEFMALAREAEIDVIPFSKSLPNFDDRSAMVFSFPDEVYEEVSGEDLRATGCDEFTMVVDESNPTDIGEDIVVNNTPATVVEKTSGAAQMNRDIGIVSESHMRECIKGDVDSPYFAAAISVEDEGDISDVENLLRQSSLEEYASLLREDEFKENNRRFWRANGTPLLLQMIAYMGVFSAFAIGSERKGMLQRNIREIGTLNASGVPMSSIMRIEMRRALKESGKATLIAAPFMPLVAGAFNMATVGLKAGVGLRELAVGYTVALGAKLTGSARAVKKFSRKMDLAESVRG